VSDVPGGEGRVMAQPRIGRADRLNALDDRAVGVLRGADAFARLLNAPLPPQAPPRRADPRAIGEHAAQLAELLAPLPRALSEIGTRISRHCAHTVRDIELALAVEQARARAFDLWLAVERLRDAAGSRP
jgi:hypothetical protein